MKPWQLLAREVILHVDRYLTVERHEIQLPDGRVMRDWLWLTLPDYINVLPVTDDGRAFCFRQTKYAVESTSLAPVGGMIDPDESPLEAARRELREEMGMEAREWVSLGSYATEANRGAGVGHLYLALGAEQVAEPQSDDLEEQELLVLDVASLKEALLRGEFKVMSWSAAVGLAVAYLDSQDNH